MRKQIQSKDHPFRIKLFQILFQTLLYKAQMQLSTLHSHKKIPIGTRVFDITKGWGEVVEYKNPCVAYESNMVVKFNGGGIYTYTLKGKYNSLDETPLLSLTEYSLETGGFTPITDFDKPEIGDFGYFWDVVWFGDLVKSCARGHAGVFYCVL